MSDCFHDWECRSIINLKARGSDVYFDYAEPTILTWAVDDDDIQTYDAFVDGPEIPADFERILADESINLIAHNAGFDRGLLHRRVGRQTRMERWRCTMAQARAAALPGSLEMAGLVLGLPESERKLSDGKALIQLFCIPRADGTFVSPFERPVEWATFKRYAVQDTATLRRIYRKLPGYNYRGDNLASWHLDQKVNERGFGFDDGLARAAVSLLERAKRRHDSDAGQLTGGQVEAVTQRDRLMRYLAARELDIPNMRAGTIREYLESDDIEPGIRLLLELRLEASKSSGAKFKKGLAQVGRRGRMRNTVNWSGARTGRNNGKGFQPLNMARPVMMVRKPSGRYELEPVKAKYIDSVVLPAIRSGAALSLPEVYGGPNEACALALRHCIVADAGNEFVVGDWSNIEGRILAWVAGELWKLQAFRDKDNGTGADLYKLLYSRFFGKLIDTINDTERQAGKVVDLSMGFHGGVGAFVTMAAGYGIDLSVLPALVLPNADPKMLKKAYKAWRRAFLTGEDFELDPQVYQACDVLKQLYRASSPAIDQIAYDIDAAIKGAIQTPGTSYSVARCTIWYADKWLIIQLPSGRRLLYADAKLHTEVRVDPETGRESRSEYVSYMVARGKTWFRLRAWSGLFVENIVQAVANDILRAAMLRVDRYTKDIPGIRCYLDTLPEDERTAITLTVHDEIVIEVPKGTVTLEKYIGILTEHTSWSTGLPLAAEGWVGPRYGKR